MMFSKEFSINQNFFSEQNVIYMKEALKEAEKAALIGEVPIGAVAVCDDQIIARSFNLKERIKDPTAHAEILILREIATKRGDWRLTDVTLYVTIEPCLMCVGALLQARIPKVVFGARDAKFGAVRSLYEAADDVRNNHRIEIVEGVLSQECSTIMKDFFQKRR